MCFLPSPRVFIWVRKLQGGTEVHAFGAKGPVEPNAPTIMGLPGVSRGCFLKRGLPLNVIVKLENADE